MKILLVEDLDEKAGLVEATLRRSLSSNNLTLHRAKSFISAIRLLEAHTYDLLLLDLVLPMRDGDSPSEKGGKDVLSEIVDGSKCRRPSHIICLTAFEKHTCLLQDEVNKNLAHVVIYDETDSKWRESLESKARYVDQRLKEAESFPQDYKIDVAIVTSSPLVELREVLKLPGPFACEYHQTDALDYHATTWARRDQQQLAILACAAPRMGMTAACVTACKVIERWRPRFLAMCGIAAATKADKHFGDILLAEAAYDYGSGKIVDTEGGERRFIPNPNPLAVDTNLHAIFQRWERDQIQTSAVQRAWHSEQQRTPQLILGLLASGAAVVQSKAVVDEILSKSGKAVGLDMEAYAIFQAAHLARAPRPRVVVAKSVSDFADSRKNDDWQQYAAFTSARFIYEFFTNATELELGVPIA